MIISELFFFRFLKIRSCAAKIIVQSALSIHGMCVPAECRISAYTWRFYSCSPPPSMPYNPTQLPESCNGYHGASTDLHVKYLS
ncbi:hypothetical protein T10_3569, partial [Trichinella papuae]